MTYYTVIPEIHPDGSMTKTVFAKADSACLAGDFSNHPFFFSPDSSWHMGVMETPVKEWFLEDSSELNFYAYRHFGTDDQAYAMTAASEDYADSPYLEGQEHLSRRRGLFFSEYTYSCTFPGIGGRMPVPLSRYMDEDEIRIWLTDAGEFQGMNGIELYSNVLGNLLDKYSDWYNACYNECIYNAISRAAGDSLTDTQRKELFKKINSGYGPFERDTDRDGIIEFAKAMSGISGKPSFHDSTVKMIGEIKGTLDSVELNAVGPMTTVLLYKVRMPGRLTSANTGLSDNGIPVWKVDGYRLLAGDVVIEATSRRANPLGFIITGIIVLAGAFFILRPRRY